MKVLFAAAFVLMSFHVTANQNSHVADFVSIFKTYCFNFKNNSSAAGVFLENRGHNRNPEFQDAYEIMIDQIDYAVTPQHQDCTADVLIKSKGRHLFHRTELNAALKKMFGLSESSSRYFQDIALNNKETKIQQTNYVGRAGHSYRLLYPQNNQDSYYMTFTVDW